MDRHYRCPFSLSPKSLLCFVALIFLTTSTIFTSPQIGENETDQPMLFEIKAKMVDPTGVLSSWKENNDLCEWYGVICGHKHRRVTMLSLQSQNLSGTLSPHLGNLSFLRELNLRNNSFNSNIPSEVGRLSRLKTLQLSHNLFSGRIPSNLSHCSNLHILYVDTNK